jgi:3-oxoacyl-[acyl-carrier-protein] synthase II
MNRVVITGLGAVTPIGIGVEEFWNGIREGKCGVDSITRFDASDYKVKIAAEVKDFVPENYMEKREVRKLDRYCQFALAAAKEAVEHSELNLDEIDSERFGVILGSGVGGLKTLEDEHEKLLNKGPKRVSPFLIPMMISNLAVGNVAIKYGAKGISNTIVTACASGSNAIGEAFRNIKHGYSDIILAGGTEAGITPIALAGFANLTALSTTEDPKRASIPFDKDRNGFVMGEGAGILILESLEHAQKRGAKIYGEIVGYGATCDAYHITSPAPDGEGAARAIKAALNEGNIKAEDVSYVNAHGTSTPYNDKFETAAVKSALGEHAYKIPMSSTKSMIGHLLGASGAVEAVACIKSLEDQFVHATVGLQNTDEECDLDYVIGEGRNTDVEYVVSNSLGFGGHNASLLFKRWSEK